MSTIPWGRIGPSAVVRVAETLPSVVGREQAQSLFTRAGLAEYFRKPPADMVDEHQVARLHHELRFSLGGELASQVAHRAGVRTADYLLKHRVPRPVQWLLRALPSHLAARVVLAAIAHNAWAFAGSGRFSALAGPPARLQIRRNPLCRDLHTETPACAYYAGTFERLFQALVHPQSRVVEVSCEACGDDACRFEVHW